MGLNYFLATKKGFLVVLTVAMWSWLSTERKSSQMGSSPLLYWTRRRMAREKQSRKPTKQKKEVMKEILDGLMVDEEEIKGSHSPNSDWRRTDVDFILVLLL